MTGNTENTDIITLDMGDAKLPEPTEFKEKLEDAFGQVYSKIEEEIDVFEPDLTTDKGRKAIASLAYKIARTKTGMAEKAKLLTADQKAIIEAVTSARLDMEKRLDGLRDKAREPLTNWEETAKRQEAEASRLRGLFSSIRASSHDGVQVLDMTSQQVEAYAGYIAELQISPDIVGADAFDQIVEYRVAAASELRDLAADLSKREEEQRELEELRKLKAEKDEADRIAAEEKARKDEQQDRADRWIADMDQAAKAAYEASGPIGDEVVKWTQVDLREDAFGEHIEKVEAKRKECVSVLNERFKKMASEEKARAQEAAAVERIEKLADIENWTRGGIKTVDMSSPQLEIALAEMRAMTLDQETYGDKLADVEIAHNAACDILDLLIDKAKTAEAEAEAKRIDDAKEAARKEAEEEAERNRREERLRQERIKEQEEEARKRREDDKAHRSSVNNGILSALREYHQSQDWDFDEDAAKNIIRAAATGNAGSMKVEY